MAKIIDNIQEMLANTDVLEFPKMKIDFTNDMNKVVISSDVDGEDLIINGQKMILQTETVETDRIILCGVDVTDEILNLIAKKCLTK